MSDSAHTMHTSTNIENRKFAMWVLIASECFLFGTLIANYLVNKGRSLSGPTPQDVYEIDITTLSTFDLLMSSVAMVLALHYCKEKDLRKFQFWTFMVVLGGLIFLGFQYHEDGGPDKRPPSIQFFPSPCSPWAEGGLRFAP